MVCQALCYLINIVATCRGRMDSYPKFSLMLTDDSTYIKRHEKIYYLCNAEFWGEQGRHPKLIWKWLVRARRGDWFGVFTVVGEWVLGEGCQRREYLGFPSGCVEVRQQRKVGGELKSSENRAWLLEFDVCYLTESLSHARRRVLSWFTFYTWRIEDQKC